MSDVIRRKVDELGRIVLPLETRKSLNINEKDELDIITKDGTIVLQKTEQSCVFCNSEIGLRTIKSRCICKDCLNSANSIEIGESVY